MNFAVLLSLFLSIPIYAADTFFMLDSMEKQCNDGQMEQCYALGRTYFNGQEIAPNYEKALVYYTKACDGNHAGGCVSLGEFYMSSDVRLLPSDPAKAQILFDKAYTIQKANCAKGIITECTATGVMILNGIGIPETLDENSVRKLMDSGMDYLRLGCQKGDTIACDAIHMYESLVPPNNP